MKHQVVILSVADLGFPEGALTRELLGSAQDQDLLGQPAPFTGGIGRQLGLELCMPDVGPALRLQYEDQPLGERIYVAMAPITTPDGDPRVFVIVNGPDGLSLDAERARPADHWAPSDRFAFCRAILRGDQR